MVFVLHGHIESLYTRLVLICVGEMGLIDTPQFEFRHVEWNEIFDSTDDEFDFKASPLKRIPWFEDTENGLRLYESRSIAKYIAQKTNSPLIPELSDPEGFATFDMACSIELGDFFFNCYSICRQLFINPVFNSLPPNKDVLDCYKTTFEKTLKNYDRLLATRPFVAGEKMTIVDLFHLPFGYMAAQSGGHPTLAKATQPFPIQLDQYVPARPPSTKSDSVSEPSQYPNVERWWSTLTALPSFKRVNDEFEKSIVTMLQKQGKRDQN
ncbi:hypothetical protein CI109_104976 [Kwoniella shandongensis]|uniref:glutathione transferase n=1 Tax=Kwoniella shandongensis TaxID=1734106 RepID=A0A5M6BQF7_9TREE|nr:uncharacterized protein CI109_006691 [Kwoniella shandongensis]KAA5524967.1 hypothetical protein CI109_006691 [Kwoniella shandongensis]